MLKYLVGLLSLVSVKSYPMNQVAILYGNARNVNLSNGCISFKVLEQVVRGCVIIVQIH